MLPFQYVIEVIVLCNDKTAKDGLIRRFEHIMEKYNKSYKTNLRLNSLKSCNQQMARVINSYLEGDIDEATARTVGYLINILYRGLEKGDLEERLEALEEATSSRRVS